MWSEQWINFVIEFMHRGDGSIPLWSFHSFQFLTVASDPQLTSLLPDQIYCVSSFIAFFLFCFFFILFGFFRFIFSSYCFFWFRC